MSLVEVFYPGNQKKREHCVRLMQEIYSAMERNFDATNDLIKIMHTHLKLQCDPLVLFKGKTIQENAENFSQKIREIQDLLRRPLQKCVNKIDPYIYKMLTSEELELSSIYEYLRIGGKTLDFGAQILLLSVAVAKTILHTVRKIVTRLGRLWVGTIILGVLLAGAIYSAIVGARERAMLESTEKELQGVVDTFVPESLRYTKEINRLEFKIEALQVNAVFHRLVYYVF
ncbi:hypothetical protein MHBO_002374 [Bonamia ostreae]|uniref:Uncharacterized protein n=1 Tax=Bonamia ostreae TaxID=126728 RepID=A0ABV2AM54_9EUKA